MQEFFKIPLSSGKGDKYPSPLYSQGGSSGKVGYVKATYVKISSNELFWDFLEMYRPAIPSRTTDGNG